jgi:hypothetical protein
VRPLLAGAALLALSACTSGHYTSLPNHAITERKVAFGCWRHVGNSYEEIMTLEHKPLQAAKTYEQAKSVCSVLHSIAFPISDAG